MSKHDTSVDLDSVDAPVCDICGTRIDEPDQDCPAQHEGGVCAP